MGRASEIAIVKGLVSMVPLIGWLGGTRKTGGSVSARYCYAVWMRHLINYYQFSRSWPVNSVAEIGPGDSLGIGIAALLTGVNKYFAFDLIEYSNHFRSLAVLDEMVQLLKNRSRIPDHKEFPDVRPLLDSYEFPDHILSNAQIDTWVSNGRVSAIREILRSEKLGSADGCQISYVVPWTDAAFKTAAGWPDYSSIDLIFSQAVFEHVDDLQETYRILSKWLVPNGLMSHQIDFSSHGTAKGWNAHWSLTDNTWKLIRGNRPYLINRKPYSFHKQCMANLGLKIVNERTESADSAISRNELAKEFAELSEQDLTTRSVFVQAVKQG